MITFNHVSKRFQRGDDTVDALVDVSFHVEQGTTALVCGPSGSGKSTIVNIAAGLMRPGEGEVTVSGNALHTMTRSQRADLRASDIAVVFQMFHLVPYLTALDNVLLPTLAVRDRHAETRARTMLEELGIADRLTHFPDEMSVGERQRCALARALLNNPKVILADEPTGNLDPISAERVLTSLTRARDAGATVLIVSHHHVEAIKPDIEFRIENGKLVQ